MDKRDEVFWKKLLATFRIEAREHITKLASGLINLERSSDKASQAEITETVFREAHSLKGAARAVNLAEIEEVCQVLESIFAALKREELPLSAPLFDLFQKAVDALTELLDVSDKERQPPEQKSVRELIRKLELTARGRPPLPQKSASGQDVPGVREQPADACPVVPPEKTETVRIAAAKMDAILLNAEELLSVRLFVEQRVTELHEVNELITGWKERWDKVLPEARSLQREPGISPGSGVGYKTNLGIRKVSEFLAWNEELVGIVSGKLAVVARATEQESRFLGSIVDSLLRDIKKALLLPFATLLEVFPKLVRDLSHAQGKDVVLNVRGGDLELDRRILEELKDPLIHIVRNCIDHGLENKEQRRRVGKPERGALTIEVVQKEGGKVEITVTDDGRGIAAEEVKEAAVKAGLLTVERAKLLGDNDALKLIFLSGVSTSPIITDLSGRGLGLAIVRETVEKLGGAITVETIPHKGTSFRATLPVTLATFRGVIVRVGEGFFVLPTIYVERVLRVSREEIKTIENREAIELEGRAVSLVRLGDILGIASGRPEDAAQKAPVVVLEMADTRIAFLLDEVLNEQEILMKDLGRQLVRVRNIAGATVLGTGQAVPVLHVPDLLKSAGRAPAAVIAMLPLRLEEKKKSLLVVEDSITARTLLKNILEAAGYIVQTAVDGLAAFNLLRAGAFDLTVSDVDMPRMNGFELTAKIRADKGLQDMPVVLVTALDSRADRERGIDVGANAYIVKSSFDQSNLLEVIGRLL